MKLVCFEGNKQTESDFFGNNYIFGKRFGIPPDIGFFSIPLMSFFSLEIINY